MNANFHIYLLMGQSNMSGRGPLDGQARERHPRILMLDVKNNWVPAQDPVHFDKPERAGVGPALSFASEMLPGHPDVTIGLVPCAVGGSPISSWEPGASYLESFHPYDDAIRRASAAMQQGVVKGILWHQGESDNNPEDAPFYFGRLQLLIERLRSDLKRSHLPFVAGEIGYFLEDNFINPQLSDLPLQVPYTAVVSAAGLADKGDRLHFDAPAARKLGRRYAAAMKELISLESNG